MARELPFAQGKKAAELWLSGSPTNDNWWPAPPDANIAPLIRALNSLPFLYTHACCGGHIRTKKAVLQLLVGGKSDQTTAGDEDFGCYSGAWFSFTVDGSAKSERFVEELRGQVMKWLGASFQELSGGDRTYGVNLTGADSNAPAKGLEEARALEKKANERMVLLITLIRRYA